MTNAPDALDRLQSTLEQLLAALESGRPDAVLECEAPLAAAVRSVDAGFTPDPGPHQAAYRRRLQAVRLLVERCRLLGASANDLAAAMFPQSVYARPVAARVRGRR